MLHTNRGGTIVGISFLDDGMVEIFALEDSVVDISSLKDGVVDISSLEDGVVGNDNTCGTCNEIYLYPSMTGTQCNTQYFI